VDVKKLYIDTTAKFSNDTIRADVDIDPWVIGMGVGYKF
jgi:outer membrane protein